MAIKIITLSLILLLLMAIIVWAIKAWKKVDVIENIEEKLEEQKTIEDAANKIRKNSIPSAWRNKKQVDKFLNN